MAKKKTTALDVLSKLDGATLESLLGLLNEQQAQSTEEPKQQEEPKKVAPKKATKTTLYQNRNREVVVHSCIDGVVTYKSKTTGMTFRWYEKGAQEILTIAELLSMDSQSKSFLHSPWLMIEDEEVVEALGLEEVYNSISKVEDVDSFINLPLEEQKDIYNKLSDTFKFELFNQIAQKVESEEIDSISKIRQLEEVLNKELTY